MFKYRYTEGTKPGIYEVITHDDCELFRKMEWQDGDDISRYVVSVHNPDSQKNENNRFLNGIDQKFKNKDGQDEIIHYRFLFAGAGDTRKQRAFFATQETFNKIVPYIMNGLTMNNINTAINGKYPCSGLRFTTYESLWLTGSTRIEDFDIDKCIVIKDLENDIHYKALKVDAVRDYVSDDLEDITKTVEITDGAGMYLPGTFKWIKGPGRPEKYIGKNITAFTARAPWFKGLMVQHDFMAAAKRTGNYIVKDAWGQDHNIFLEGINCIWTTSQLKLWKAYESWDHYKRYFKELNQYFCMALTPESKNKLDLSYQSLQDLRATEDQVRNLLKNQFNKLWRDYGRVDNRSSDDPNTFAYNYEATLKDIGLYQLPIFKEVRAMLNCKWVKRKVREYLKNEFKKIKYGKIRVKGMEPFVSPDWNWVCNKLFGDNMPIVPTDKICYKDLKENQEVDLVRYPHLYTGAHCVRSNMKIDGLHSDVIYVDANGITAMLCEADFDGDHLQVFTDNAFLAIVKDNVNRQPPIYYECSSGSKYPVLFDYSEHGVFQELRNSYGDNANVGVPSNYATKVFNNTKYNWEQKYRIVRMLAHMIQGCIDFPKAGVSYFIPQDIIKDIKHLPKPAFMKYAKEVEDKNRLVSLNRKEMVKITREIFNESYGGNVYPEQLSDEDYKKMLIEYRKRRTTYERYINYAEPRDRDNAEYIMDWVWILCSEEQDKMNISEWYAPFEVFNMDCNSLADVDFDNVDTDDDDFVFGIRCLGGEIPGEEFKFDETVDQLPKEFVQFIKECDDKYSHPDYSERINSQTMFNPCEDIQVWARREFRKRFPKMTLKSYSKPCLFRNVLANNTGTGFAFCQYVWPNQLLKYAKGFPVKKAESNSVKKSDGGKIGGPIGGKIGDRIGKSNGGKNGTTQKKCFIIFEDTNECCVFESLERAATFAGCSDRAIRKAKAEDRKFKCKNYNNRKARLVIPND